MFWNNLVRLCKQNGTKPNPLAKKLGIASGTVTAWKNGSIPQANTLLKLADYFGVTPDYLLGKTETKQEKPSAESEELIRKLLNTPSNKATVVMFGGDGPKVVEISPESVETVRRMLEALDKKD